MEVFYIYVYLAVLAVDNFKSYLVDLSTVTR